MANAKISELPAVATPALTDQFAVNQDGTTKKVTLQQIAGAAGEFNPSGTSRIQVNSTTQIQLNVGVIPLFVNSIWQIKPVTSAVTVSNGGLSANTTYFVYAFDNAGTLTLEIVTTAHATDSTYGVEIKSGDATRTLVGMVRTNASSQFVNALTQRFILSWFSRQPVDSLNRLTTADATTTSTSYAELSTTLLRAEFLTWPNVACSLSATGSATVATNNGFLAIGVDNTTALASAFISSADQSGQKVLVYSAQFAEGYHYTTVLAKIITSGTVTAFGSTSLGGETLAVMAIQANIVG